MDTLGIMQTLWDEHVHPHRRRNPLTPRMVRHVLRELRDPGSRSVFFEDGGTVLSFDDPDKPFPGFVGEVRVKVFAISWYPFEGPGALQRSLVIRFRAEPPLEHYDDIYEVAHRIRVRWWHRFTGLWKIWCALDTLRVERNRRVKAEFQEYLQSAQQQAERR